MALRRRDGVPPWGVHPCEVDALDQVAGDGTAFSEALRQARALRAVIEDAG
jgi:hypothetical protein